ncbi:hypothetical protein AVEN_205849-1 [Araneus ventricosus]|uniref:Uncharacterized protein n=1 Tax=Araneus ventricosus TaxID=182803 RepID=A0A4Y2Q8J8_ARAVE|nr:hypothetical protein AVEN_205849-1 [Araneus ventricosus]
MLVERLSPRRSSIGRQRPYHAESTGSRLITAVKQHRARLVPGRVTTWEHRVLLAYFKIPTTKTVKTALRAVRRRGDGWCFRSVLYRPYTLLG